MYIQRLDSEHVEGWTRNAGWQVRYQRPWRYFADSGLPPGKRTGRRGSPQESLKRATEYLLKIYQGQRGKLRASEARRKRDKLGVPGVRAVIKKSTKRNLLEYYVEVGPIPAVRRVPRRFYVGTENTITRER